MTRPPIMRERGPITVEQMRDEAARELRMRKNFYSRRVREHQMNAGEAAFRIDCMSAIVELLTGMLDQGKLL